MIGKFDRDEILKTISTNVQLESDLSVNRRFLTRIIKESNQYHINDSMIPNIYINNSLIDIFYDSGGFFYHL